MRRNKQMKLIAAVGILTVALFTGCAKKTGADGENVSGETGTQGSIQEETVQGSEISEETEPSREGMARSFLTGEWVPEEYVKRRPISVMFNNLQAAVPQTGISRAGVIYEAPVEGRITRLMGVFDDFEDLDKIGSVRSARTYFVFWSQQWDSIYAHFGQCNYANDYLRQIDNLNGVEGIGSTVYYRSKDRKAPHNAYTSTEGLLAGIEKKKYRTELKEDFDGVFVFADKKGDVTLADGMDATYVFPGYRENKIDAHFDYDETTHTYLRFEYGEKQIDDMTGEQLAVENIIIQYCDWESYYGTQYLFIHIWDPEGEGYYITEGKAIPIKWVGGEEYAPTSYYDLEGNELVLNPGKTWICTVLTDQQSRTVIE